MTILGLGSRHSDPGFSPCNISNLSLQIHIEYMILWRTILLLDLTVTIWSLPLAYEVRREGNVFSLSVCSLGGRGTQSQVLSGEEERGTKSSGPRSFLGQGEVYTQSGPKSGYLLSPARSYFRGAPNLPLLSPPSPPPPDSTRHV